MDAIAGMDLIGIGLYDVPEAARLTRVRAPKIRRWVRGYNYAHDGQARHSEPLWRTVVPEFDGKVGLDFRDLTEIRVVGALRAAGIGLPTIRLAIERAREIVGDERPLSTETFRTDGKSIFLKLAGTSDDPVLLNLKSRQFGIQRLIEPSFKDLDFENSAAVRWWPAGRRKGIVIDPRRSFGQPIVADGGVPTSVLRDAVAAEGSVANAARYFDLPPAVVRGALAYEESLAA
ncbi:MAG: DUF433 domain-containing protein [Rhodobacterales bacterium]|nr:DUF433 domain-containing protein [Rhodobacterales bacterium]